MVQLRSCYPGVGFLGMTTNVCYSVRNSNMKPILRITLRQKACMVLSAIYGRDIATGGAAGLGEAVFQTWRKKILWKIGMILRRKKRGCLEKHHNDLWTGTQLIQLHQALRKGRKTKIMGKGRRPACQVDPFLDMVGELRGDLKKASQHFGEMAEAMEREVQVQENAMQKDPMQILQEKSVEELNRLGFTGTEAIKAARHVILLFSNFEAIYIDNAI